MLSPKTLVGLIVGALCLFGIGIGVAVWWFVIRGAPVIVLPVAEEEEEEFVQSSVGYSETTAYDALVDGQVTMV
jgi:hypothetical protein